MDPLFLFWLIGFAILILGLMLNPFFLIVGIVTLISYFIFGVEIASLIGGIALLIVFATRIGGPH
jgi:hypothetical protein